MGQRLGVGVSHVAQPTRVGVEGAFTRWLLAAGIVAVIAIAGLATGASSASGSNVCDVSTCHTYCHSLVPANTQCSAYWDIVEGQTDVDENVVTYDSCCGVLLAEIVLAKPPANPNFSTISYREGYDQIVSHADMCAYVGSGSEMHLHASNHSSFAHTIQGRGHYFTGTCTT